MLEAAEKKDKSGGDHGVVDPSRTEVKTKL